MKSYDFGEDVWFSRFDWFDYSGGKLDEYCGEGEFWCDESSSS